VAHAGPTKESNALAASDFAALTAQVFKSVGAQGFVLSTDKAGRVIRTTDASDCRIRKVTFDPQTNTADVVVVLERYTMVVKQNRRRSTEGWRPAERGPWAGHPADRQVSARLWSGIVSAGDRQRKPSQSPGRQTESACAFSRRDGHE
jgi:hypothetical protein